MREEIIISKPEEADLISGCEVFEKSIRDTFLREGLQDLKELMLEEIEFKKSSLRNSVMEKETDTCFLVAKKNDLVIGTISYGPCGKEIRDCTENGLDHLGELGSLYVHPEYQEMGVGRLLILALVHDLNQRGIEAFCLDSGYKSAQKKWINKFGTPYRIVKDYWGEGGDHMIWVCKTADYLR